MRTVHPILGIIFTLMVCTVVAADDMTSASYHVTTQAQGTAHSDVSTVEFSTSASYQSVFSMGDVSAAAATSAGYTLGDGYTYTLNNPSTAVVDQDSSANAVRFPVDTTFTLTDTPGFGWVNSGDSNNGDGLHFQYQIATDSGMSAIVLDSHSSVADAIINWDYAEQIGAAWNGSYPAAGVEGDDNDIDGATADFILARPASSLASGIYYWRVRPYDDFEYGDWSSTFEVQVTPPSPTLNTPADTAMLNDDTPDFDWADNSAPWNVTYQIQIATDNTFTTIVEDQTGLGTSELLGTSLSASLPDEKYYWRVRSFDGAVNPTPWSATREFTIDTNAPSGTISIDAGATHVGTTSVTLTLTSSESNLDNPGQETSGVVSMEFSNDSTTWSGVEAVDTTKAWTLTVGDATKTVYVRFYDNAGNVSGNTAISDTIILDTADPTGTVSIDAGAAETNSTSVTLTLSGTDASALQMRFSNDGTAFSAYEAFNTTKAWTLSGGDGTRTVYMQLQDEAGNTSSIVPLSGAIQDDIVLDQTGPDAPTLISPPDLFTTDITTPTLDWSDAVDPDRDTSDGGGVIAQYDVEVDDDNAFGSPDFTDTVVGSPATSTTAISPALANGTWYWRVRARDAAGNIGSWATAFSFEVTNAVAAVVLTPPTITADAGVPVVFSAQLQDSGGTPISANAITDVTFSIVTGSGTLGTPTLSGGAVQVTYTTAGTPENAEIRVVENRSGSSFADTAQILSQGTMSVFEGSGNPNASNQLAGSSNVAAVQMLLQTGPGESMVVSATAMTISGTGVDDVDITDITLVEDTNGSGQYEVGVDRVIATGGTFDSDDGTVSFSGLNETLASDSDFTWLYAVTFNSPIVANSTYTFAIDPVTSLTVNGADSNALIVPSGVTFSGGPVTIVDPGGTGSLTLGAGTNNACDKNELTDGLAVEMIQFALTASSVEDIIVDALSIDAAGTGADDTDIITVALYQDSNGNGVFDAGGVDRLISNTTYAADDGTINFTGLTEIISAGSSTEYLIIYDFGGTASINETFSVTVSAASISATGNTSNDVIAVGGSSASGAIVTITDTGGSSLGGSLTIYSGENNPSNQSEVNSVENLVIQQVLLAASSVEALSVTSITFTASGTGDDFTDITAINLAVDTDKSGDYDPNTDRLIGPTDQVYSADNGVVGFNGLSETISAGGILHLILVYDMAGTANENETFSASVAFDANIVASGVTTATSINPCGAPKIGGTLIIADPSTSAGSLRVRLGNNTPSDTNQTNDATNVEMAQLSLLTSSLENIQVDAVTVHVQGTGVDNVDISEVILAQDVNENGIYEPSSDRIIGSGGTFSANNGSVTFSGLTEDLIAGTTENWLVVYSFGGVGSLGSTFQCKLKTVADISATGATSGADIDPFGLPVDGSIVTLVASGSPGNLTVNAGPTMPPSATLPQGTTVEGVFQVQLTASSVENLDVTSLTVNGSGTGDDATEIVGVTLWRDLNENGFVDIGTDTIIQAAQVFGADDGTVVFNGFTERIDRDTTVTWLVSYDISNSAVDGSTFTASLDPSSDIVAIGVSSASTITPSGGTVTGNEFTVGGIGSGAKGTLIASLGANIADPQAQPAFAQNVQCLQWNLRAGQLEDIVVQAITFAISGTGNDPQDVQKLTFAEDVNGDGEYDPDQDRLVAQLTNPFKTDDGTATFTGLTERITKATENTYVLTINFTGLGAVGGTFEVTLDPSTSVTAQGIDSALVITASGNAMTGAQITLSPIAGSSGSGGGAGGCMVSDAQPSVAWLGLALLLILVRFSSRRKRRKRS
jgi:hypothetical protein